MRSLLHTRVRRDPVQGQQGPGRITSPPAMGSASVNRALRRPAEQVFPSAKTLVRRLINGALRLLGFAIVRRSRLANADARRGPSFVSAPLPTGAAEVLRRDHPLLKEYEQRYRHHAATGSQWSPEYTRNEIDLRYFRGDNAFVWQPHGGADELRYALTSYYTRLHDRHGLLERLDEDGLFGAYTYEIDGNVVSRDLLDSIVELMFLDDELAIGSRATTILDIGAGYGRLAHRATTAYQNITYLCTDAVPESTFLSDFYLDYRGIADRAHVLPLDEVAGALDDQAIDVAVNIHSFSECPLSAIEWWLDLLAANRVEYLMIVPNTEGALLSRERGDARLDFMPAIQTRQFELVRARPKYGHSDVVQRNGLFPTTYFLFRRQHS